MTAAAFAGLAQARPIGRGRWQAKCPAHPDKSPSLAIKEGQESRVLVRCWAGCELSAVLAALGLGMRDLFAGEPPSRAAMQQAHSERLVREQAESVLAARERKLCDVARRMHFAIAAFAARLMLNPSCDLTAALLAEAFKLCRTAEGGLPPC